MSMLLDTNVVSKLIRKVPKPTVVSWVSDHPLDDLFFSAVSEAEWRYGAAILPTGRRRDTLFLKIEAMLHDAFGDRVIPFDSADARSDCQIAAIAASLAWWWRRAISAISKIWKSRLWIPGKGHEWSDPLPDFHAGPADRIIVGTALEGHRLLTADAGILRWSENLNRLDARE
ncbi:MAG: hypothetical protein F4Z18_00355 [Caldilineaceae bacterium SB0666_bin_21]|nr:hypothetical protein [Caldilineaceae bacterium]MXZ40253.1 hypothetical protein [Caldilineaceae bacterium SB0666_bin_21]